MKDVILYFMAFLGCLLMFIGAIKMFHYSNEKNIKNNRKKNKSIYIKLAILGFIVFIISRIIHGRIL